MKSKKLYRWLVLFLALIVLFFVFKCFNAPISDRRIHSLSEKLPPDDNSHNGNLEKSQASKIDMLEKAYQVAAEAQNVDVKFYGKVVDQDFQPVVGARVAFEILNGGASISTADIGDAYGISATSGIDGQFAIEGLRGRALTVVGISKDGYYPVSAVSKTYGYSDTPKIYAPNKANPEIFVISNREINRFRGELAFPIVWNGGFGSYAMMDSKRGGGVGGADQIMVSAKRLAPAAQGIHFDWSVTLKVEGAVCKLAENGDTRVPIEGYKDEVVVGYSSNQSPWMSSADFTLFYQKNDGGGAAVVTIYSDFNRMGRTFHADCYTFPKGTRVFGEKKH